MACSKVSPGGLRKRRKLSRFEALTIGIGGWIKSHDEFSSCTSYQRSQACAGRKRPRDITDEDGRDLPAKKGIEYTPWRPPLTESTLRRHTIHMETRIGAEIRYIHRRRLEVAANSLGFELPLGWIDGYTIAYLPLDRWREAVMLLDRFYEDMLAEPGTAEIKVLG